MLRNITKRYPLVISYLFFFYFSGVTQVLILASGLSGTVGLRQAIIISALWLIPLLIWPAHAKKIAAATGILLWVASLTSFGYWLIYKQDFSQSVIFIIFESDMTESKEFITSYLRYWHIVAFMIFSLFPIFIWKKITPTKMERHSRYIISALIVVVAFWPFINHLTIKKSGVDVSWNHQLDRMEPAAPWNLLVGYARYKVELAAMQEHLADIGRVPPIENLADLSSGQEKTIVLVIGESTNRQRMSLYGYPRETTPRLTALGDEVIAFDNVITSRPYTIAALQQALSFADSSNIDGFFTKPTLLSLMRQAGYQSTWITNQRTQIKKNTMLTTLSQLADHQVYLNNNRTGNSSQYDGDVLEPFRQALEKPAAKKAIIIHLLGAHRRYDYRYPPEFQHFNDSEGIPVSVASENLSTYNEYDNAILYNDYIIARLIEDLRKIPGQSSLIYFADHGEEVFDYPERPFCGRNETNPTPAMYTVPFIFWANDEYQTAYNTERWRAYRSRPYSTADFIYSWADAARLSFSGFKPEKSIFSDNFRAGKRLIGDPASPKDLKDYDQFFSHTSQ